VTAVFADPFEEFLAQDPSILREPTLTQGEAVIRGHGLVAPAIGLGASYLVYRGYMAQQIKKETQKRPFDMSRKVLRSVATTAWHTFVPFWVKMTAPYIAAGYIEGAQSVVHHQVPEEMLQGIAQDYAKSMGNQINETSMDAMLSGYQAQVNRKVPSITAAQRVADAYGVTQRPMNTLVNVWTGEDAKVFTDQVLPSPKVERAKLIINTQNALRARTIGENEAWSAKTQGKQVVWMYGVEHGIIPIGSQRRWITAADEKVCPTCGPMSGKQAAIKEKFKTASGEVWTPPAHVNCRCDVLLDVDPIDELNALMDSESVSKAMGSDRYDRSTNGRFARTESRRSQMDEDDENFRQMLSQVNRALAPPKRTEETKETVKPAGPIQRTIIGGGQIGGGQIGGGQIGGSASTSRIISAPIGSETRTSTPIKSSTLIQGKQVQGTQVSRGPIDRQINPIQSPFTEIQEAVKAPETKAGEWPPLPHSLVAVYSPDEWEEITVAGETKAALSHPFYEKHSPQDVDVEGSSLHKRLQEYWYDVIDSEMLNYNEKYAAKNKFLSYRDTASGEKFLVTEDDYLAALIATVDKGEAEYAEEREITLQSMGVPRVQPIEVSPAELADYLQLYDRVVEPNRPILMETNNASPELKQQHGSGISDVYSNPGFWQFDQEIEQDDDDYNFPQATIVVKPGDNPTHEPTDFTWPSGR